MNQDFVDLLRAFLAAEVRFLVSRRFRPRGRDVSDRNSAGSHRHPHRPYRPYLRRSVDRPAAETIWTISPWISTDEQRLFVTSVRRAGRRTWDTSQRWNNVHRWNGPSHHDSLLLSQLRIFM